MARGLREASLQTPAHVLGSVLPNAHSHTLRTFFLPGAGLHGVGVMEASPARSQRAGVGGNSKVRFLGPDSASRAGGSEQSGRGGECNQAA